MKRKLQVFISSTYQDLKAERQAAVEAILKAGHIPAGMELFTAGSESQLNVIRGWIEQSDVYVLILGGRYGSIEPKTQLSYSEVEFDYARSIGKPFFSIVITDEAIDVRLKERGTEVIERVNEAKYRAFREKVLSQLVAFFSSPQEVRLAIFETLPQLEPQVRSGGWISAADVTPSEDVARELTALLEENRHLRGRVIALEGEISRAKKNAPNHGEMVEALSHDIITVPAKLAGGSMSVDLSLLELAIAYADDLARGVSNALGASESERFCFYHVAARLASYGLAEESKVPARVSWQRLKLSKEGIKFLTETRISASPLFSTSAAEEKGAATATSSSVTKRSRKKTEKGRT
jgi:hypothetical protein